MGFFLHFPSNNSYPSLHIKHEPLNELEHILQFISLHKDVLFNFIHLPSFNE